MLCLEKLSRFRLLMGLNQGLMLSKKLRVSLSNTNELPTTLGSAGITRLSLPDRVFNNNNNNIQPTTLHHFLPAYEGLNFYFVAPGRKEFYGPPKLAANNILRY